MQLELFTMQVKLITAIIGVKAAYVFVWIVAWVCDELDIIVHSSFTIDFHFDGLWAWQ